MKRFTAAIGLVQFLTTYVTAPFLPAHAGSQCSPAPGTQCLVDCKRSLGEQCLITHIDFSGDSIRSGTEIWKAKFLTCSNANIDLQFQPISLALENNTTSQLAGIVSAVAASTNARAELSGIELERNTKGSFEAELARLPFKGFLNSGTSHVTVSFKLEQCGTKDTNDHCAISGRLIAITDPNIRCEFHDTTKPGAYQAPSLLTSPSEINTQYPVGRIGPQ